MVSWRPPRQGAVFLLACASLCLALPAFGGVTISLSAPFPLESGPLVAALLSSPERMTAQGLVRYRAAGWSEHIDAPSRLRLLAGRHGPAYDDPGSAAWSAADMPWALAAPDARKAPQQEGFEDIVVSLIDELSVRDPALFNDIRAEEARIRALPTREERVAAVNAAYPLLEKRLDRSAAEGRLSPEGAAKWALFRGQAKAALADGTLFEKALFAGRAFDEKVQRLLDQGVTLLDPDRRLPEKKAEYMRLSQKIHEKLLIPGNSTALTTRQLDEAFGGSWAGNSASAPIS